MVIMERDEWESNDITCIHFPTTIEFKSAFSVEAIMALAAMQLIATRHQWMGAEIVTDCKSVEVVTISPFHVQRRTKHSDHAVLHQLAKLRQLHNTTIRHVKAHPEIRDPSQSTWSQDEWGNYMADQCASGNRPIKATRFITIEIINVLQSLIQSYPGWLLLDQTSMSPITRDLREINYTFYRTTYLQQRDLDRLANGKAAKWATASIQFARHHFRTQGHSQRANGIRIGLDKSWHGGNREKGGLDNSCALCNEPDSQEHWLFHCPATRLEYARTRAAVERYCMTPCNELTNRVRSTFSRMLSRHDAGMWTGMWPEGMRARLTNSLPELDTRQLQSVKRTLKQLSSIVGTGVKAMWTSRNDWECSSINSVSTAAQALADDVTDDENSLFTSDDEDAPTP
jgi:hypothetical protein